MQRLGISTKKRGTVVQTAPAPVKSSKQSTADSVPKASNNGHKSILCNLREKKKLSQRKLAGKIGIHRTRLTRLEKKSWRKISLDELEKLSRGLDIRPEELLFHFNGLESHAFTRASDVKPVYAFGLQDDAKLSSLIAKRDNCFIGILEIPPQKTLIRENSPHGSLVFGFVLEGKVFMSFPGKELVLGKGECFSMEGRTPYELYNCSQIKLLKLMVITLPAFM